jgi:pentatricopeptide repeat protein
MIKLGQSSVSYEFEGLLSDELKNVIWQTYQTYIYKKPGEKIVNAKDRIAKVEEIINSRLPRDQISLDKFGELKEAPEKYLEVAEKLQTKIKEIIFSTIEKKQQFEIVNNCFKQDVDEAERHIQQTFEDLFNHYFQNNQLDEAYRAAQQLRYSEQGAEALLTLVLAYLNQSNKDQVALILDDLEVHHISNHILIQFINKMHASSQGPDFPLYSTLLLALEKTSNNQVKAKIISEIIEKPLSDEKEEEAFHLIEIITDIEKRTPCYTKMIDWYLGNKQITKALDLIKQLDSSNLQDEKYLRVIEFYQIQRDIQNALQTIRLINSQNTQDLEYIKIVDLCKSQQDIQNALQTIRLINSQNTQDLEYIKIIGLYKSQQDIQNALQTIRLINSQNTQNLEYIKIVDLYKS